MTNIKMYWWNEQPNFGDGLNPYLVEKITGEHVKWSLLSEAELVGAGSLLQWVAKIENELTKPIHVWGSGYMFDEEPGVKSDLVVHAAVRGQQSADYGKLGNITLGDPGLLADMLLKAPITKKYQIGVVPHLWHLDDPTLLTLINDNPKVKLIDVRYDPVAVIEQIAQCEFIFSSSLHGLIIADSMKVPNQWVQFTKPLPGGDWKFLDYYTVFNIEPQAHLMNVGTNLTAMAISTAREYVRPNLQTIKADLLHSFPSLSH